MTHKTTAAISRGLGAAGSRWLAALGAAGDPRWLRRRRQRSDLYRLVHRHRRAAAGAHRSQRLLRRRRGECARHLHLPDGAAHRRPLRPGLGPAERLGARLHVDQRQRHRRLGQRHQPGPRLRRAAPVQHQRHGRRPRRRTGDPELHRLERPGRRVLDPVAGGATVPSPASPCPTATPTASPCSFSRPAPTRPAP